MAKLKGGELLLDFSNDSSVYLSMDDSLYVATLTKEQVDAILQKGCAIKVRTEQSLSSYAVVLHCFPQWIDFNSQTQIFAGNYNDSDELTYDIIIHIDYTESEPRLLIGSISQ